MSKQTIDNELLSKEREDIFDEYYNLIEAFKIDILKAGISKEKQPNYDIIERALTILERNLDDLAKFELKKPNLVQLGNSSIQKMLKEWSGIFRVLGTRREFIFDFSYNILISSALLANIKKIDALQFRKYIKFLSPRRMDRLNYEGEDESGYRRYSSSSIAVYHVEDKKGMKYSARRVPRDLVNSDILANSIKIRRNNNNFKSILFDKILNLEIEDLREKINSNHIISEIEKERELPRNTSFEWTLELKFNDLNDNYSATQIGYTIWSISTALEQIDGVKVKLEDWGLGSRWARIKIQIRDFLAKEEVKEVLDKSKDAVEAKYLDTPIEEAKKIKAEREKLQKETEGLIDSKDADKLRKLEIEKLELENRAAEIRIMQDKLNVIKGISQLVADGVIQNDSKIQVMVNDMLFLEKDNEGFRTGEDIEIIEEDQIIKKKEKDSES
ncbi:hypothetical protein [uncultured Christiangramia sp.]|uniref:hypothetical protein n=1 Tax=Christiangramia sp. 3-2217-3z TaxID=3417564 RepID=UPI002618F1B4|nr:hypothetical protein [uncultured Christiangramia sp.]